MNIFTLLFVLSLWSIPMLAHNAKLSHQWSFGHHALDTAVPSPPVVSIHWAVQRSNKIRATMVPSYLWLRWFVGSGWCYTSRAAFPLCGNQHPPRNCSWRVFVGHDLCSELLLGSTASRRMMCYHSPSLERSLLINPIECLGLRQDNTMYLIGFSPVNSWYPQLLCSFNILSIFFCRIRS